MRDLLLRFFCAFKRLREPLTHNIGTHPQIIPLFREISPDLDDHQVHQLVQALQDEVLLLTNLSAWITQEYTNAGGYLALSREEFGLYFGLGPGLAKRVFNSMEESGHHTEH